ncbi:hypothetical protein DdX_11625 [Ditylenchus destructor]|uniref:Uncharacterized protein n=1 Tax=Ditylenchus destructor TaxID=166010 RepID=A0AAD4R132_9BILA|nr:hypothetical protein DdX_11625 [Ditylenchus destructor]
MRVSLIFTVLLLYIAFLLSVINGLQCPRHYTPSNLDCNPDLIEPECMKKGGLCVVDARRIGKKNCCEAEFVAWLVDKRSAVFPFMYVTVFHLLVHFTFKEADVAECVQYYIVGEVDKAQQHVLMSQWLRSSAPSSAVSLSTQINPVWCRQSPPTSRLLVVVIVD